MKRLPDAIGAADESAPHRQRAGEMRLRRPRAPAACSAVREHPPQSVIGAPRSLPSGNIFRERFGLLWNINLKAQDARVWPVEHEEIACGREGDIRGSRMFSPLRMLRKLNGQF